MKSTECNSNQQRSPVSARGLRVAVVRSNYHQDICCGLAAGARDAFICAGGDIADLIEVESPGAYELVAIGGALADRADIDAVVALGCVLTGETSHDRYLCDAVANGLIGITLRTGKPVAFGVLTCVTIDQARARSGCASAGLAASKGLSNKGTEAMHAAISAACTIAQISRGGLADAVPATRPLTGAHQ